MKGNSGTMNDWATSRMGHGRSQNETFDSIEILVLLVI